MNLLKEDFVSLIGIDCFILAIISNKSMIISFIMTIIGNNSQPNRINN